MESSEAVGCPKSAKVPKIIWYDSIHNLEDLVVLGTLRMDIPLKIQLSHSLATKKYTKNTERSSPKN